jgi:anti-anti-sigma factor
VIGALSSRDGSVTMCRTASRFRHVLVAERASGRARLAWVTRTDGVPTIRRDGRPVVDNLTIHTRELDGGALIRVEGELDSIGADAFVSASGRMLQEHRRVVVDLGGVRFIDSTGLRAVLAVQRTAARAGTTVTTRRLSPEVERLLEITGNRGALDVEGDALPAVGS